MEANETQAVQKRKRQRSPSYPGINLGDALEKARILFDKDGQNSVPVDIILNHWGYASGSSLGMVALSALIKFGLLDDEGSGKSREARITDLAMEILWGDGDVEKKEAIERAALLPTIHSELWIDEFAGDLPSNSTLEARLVRRGFTSRAAKSFVAQFKATLSFAGLIESDSISEDENDRSDLRNAQEESSEVKPASNIRREKSTRVPPVSGINSVEPEMIEIQIPLTGAAFAILQIPAELDETTWAELEGNLKTALTMYKQPVVSRLRSSNGAESDERSRDEEADW